MMKICKICGRELSESDNLFCPSCGYVFKENNQTNKIYYLKDSLIGNIIKADDKLANFASSKINKNKYYQNVMNRVAPKTKNYSHGVMDSSTNKKLFEHIEPEFLEVYKTIKDEDEQTLFWFERMKLMGGGGISFSILGIVVPTLLGLGLGAGGTLIPPTVGLSSDEKLSFYRDLLSNLRNEINAEKKKKDFNMDKFYEKKLNEAILKSNPVSFIPNALKSRHKIKKF